MDFICSVKVGGEVVKKIQAHSTGNNDLSFDYVIPVIEFFYVLVLPKSLKIDADGRGMTPALKLMGFLSLLYF